MELNEIFTSFEMNLLLILFIISFSLNLLSLLFFISTLTYLNKLKSSPKIDDLLYFRINNKSLKYLTNNTLVSLDKSVKENKTILKAKDTKEKYGLSSMSVGLVATAIFIFNIVLILK